MCDQVMTDDLQPTEHELLSCMTNDLYIQKYSLITDCFPIMSTVGRRLVDTKLLKREEYEDLCGQLGDCHHTKSAGTNLVKYLLKRGPDSMRKFYKVLLEYRDRDPDVTAIVDQLEEAAADRYRFRCRKTSAYSFDGELNEHMPLNEPAANSPLQGYECKRTSIGSNASSGVSSRNSSSSSVATQQRPQSSGSQNLRSVVRQMGCEISELREDMTQLRGDVSKLDADMQMVLENTFKIMNAVGTSTGSPSMDLSYSSANLVSFPSSRKGSMQSEDILSKQMQVWQPPVSKHTYQLRRDSTLQPVPEEPASMTPDVPHYSNDVEGHAHRKEGTGHLDDGGTSSAAATNDSQPIPVQKKTPTKLFKSLFRKNAKGP